MPAFDLKHELIEQLDFAWNYHFLDRMKGLSDDEYLWEPVADIWTVYPDKNGEEPTADPNVPADPAPFTTIAWRMLHMAEMFTRRRVNHFGDPSSEEMAPPISLSADGGMENLTATYNRWKDELESMPLEKLNHPCGPAEGPYAEHPFITLVLHLNREFIHHASECCLLRDLYRQKDSLSQPPNG